MFLLLILICQHAFSQSPQNVQVNEIDKVVQQLKSDSLSYKRVEPYAYTTSFGKCFREAFVLDKDVKVVVLNNRNESGQQVVKYYFKEKQLIYVEQYRISPKGEVTSEKLYLQNTRLVAWINTGGEFVNSALDKFKKVEREVLLLAEQLREDAASFAQREN